VDSYAYADGYRVTREESPPSIRWHVQTSPDHEVWLTVATFTDSIAADKLAHAMCWGDADERNETAERVESATTDADICAILDAHGIAYQTTDDTHDSFHRWAYQRLLGRS
jgi:hypothetical protein